MPRTTSRAYGSVSGAATSAASPPSGTASASSRIDWGRGQTAGSAPAPAGRSGWSGAPREGPSGAAWALGAPPSSPEMTAAASAVVPATRARAPAPLLLPLPVVFPAPLSVSPVVPDVPVAPNLPTPHTPRTRTAAPRPRLLPLAGSYRPPFVPPTPVRTDLRPVAPIVAVRGAAVRGRGARGRGCRATAACPPPAELPPRCPFCQPPLRHPNAPTVKSPASGL